MPTLPSAALDSMPFGSLRFLYENITPVHFTNLYYSAEEEVASLLEVDDRTWVERTRTGETNTYVELHESPQRVVLYDASRDSKIIIDWKLLDVTVIDDGVSNFYFVEDYGTSFSPQVPPDYWFF